MTTNIPAKTAPANPAPALRPVSARAPAPHEMGRRGPRNTPADLVRPASEFAAWWTISSAIRATCKGTHLAPHKPAA